MAKLSARRNGSGLIFAAGELAAHFRNCALAGGRGPRCGGLGADRWIELRGGTEPAEARQAVESVRLFIEQHGEARFASVDDADARPVANRAGYRKGSGAEREWWVLPEVWRAEICAGHDAQFVARVLAERGNAADAGRRLAVQGARRDATLRAYVVTAASSRGRPMRLRRWRDLAPSARARRVRNRAERLEHLEH